jgi:hypothetical protein
MMRRRLPAHIVDKQIPPIPPLEISPPPPFAKGGNGGIWPGHSQSEQHWGQAGFPSAKTFFAVSIASRTIGRPT